MINTSDDRIVTVVVDDGDVVVVVDVRCKFEFTLPLILVL